MRIESFLYAGLLFSVVMLSAFTFHGNMINDYSDDSAFNSTNVTTFNNAPYETLLANITDTTVAAKLNANNQSGLLGTVNKIPIIGSVTVQVVSGVQLLSGFISVMWNSFNLGMNMVDLTFNLIPGFPQYVFDAAQTALVLGLLIAIVSLVVKRRA